METFKRDAVVTSFKVPVELHRRFKMLCLMKNQTMNDILVRRIEAWVLNQEREQHLQASGVSSGNRNT